MKQMQSQFTSGMIEYTRFIVVFFINKMQLNFKLHFISVTQGNIG